MRSSLNKILFALLFAGAASPAFSLETAPDYFLFKGAPGKKVTQTLTIKNSDAFPQKIALGFEPWQKGQDASFVSFSPDGFKLKSGESKKVSVICRVPKQQGELYGNLVIKSVPQTENAYELRLKTEVCLQIEGTQLSDLSFAGISAERKGRDLWVQANMKNTGNIKLIPKLVAQMGDLKDMDQAQVLSAQKTVFYPNEQGAFSGSLPLADGSSKYQRIFVTAFYHAADGQLARKSESFIVEAMP